MVAFNYWLAIRTVKDKIGTWKGYEKALELAPETTREDWAAAIGQAKAALANRVDEMTRPLNRRPVAGEITTYATKAARGYMQQVEVYVRDRDTGLVEARPYTVRGDTLRSRAAVIREALDRYQGAIDSDPERYPEDILGTAYVGTHHLIPKA